MNFKNLIHDCTFIGKVVFYIGCALVGIVKWAYLSEGEDAFISG